MVTSEQIRTAFDRSVKALTAKPWIGRKTYLTKVRIRAGFTCDIEEGPWTLTTDLGKKGGGNETGPTPGMLARAALGSCVAMCYVMWAAKLEVPMSQVEVDIEADTDLRGMYGVAAIPAGYTEVRYRVTIESPAAEADVMRVLDIADAHSPYVDVFGRAQTLKREVNLITVEG